MLPWLVLLWSVGVTTLGCYQLAGWLLIRRLRLSAAPTTDPRAITAFNELIDRLQISRPVQLSRSILVQVPTVIGWLKPIVLLPINALTGLTTDQLRGLLAHELAHVRRLDYLANIIQIIIETILFYHPAIWWMGKVIRQERENACDDLAAAVCDRATYAQALATMESLRQSPTLVLSARGGVLLPRIRRILGLSDSPSRRTYFPNAAIASILIAAAISLVIFHTRPSQAETPSTSTHPSSSTTTQPELKFTDPTPDDLKATSQDYQIGKNDLLSVSINDLQGPNVETTKQLRVSESGKINLPVVGETRIVGNTEVEAQKAIANAYANIVKNAAVSVQVVEARGRTFSILGAVQQPGQYAMPKSDFRLLDALVLAHDVTAPVHFLFIVRNDPNQPAGQTRNIQIPFNELRNGNMKYNIVIHPDDLIVIQSPVQDDDPTARRIWQIKQDLADLDLSFQDLSKKLGANNPRIQALQNERDLMAQSLRDLGAPTPASQPTVQGEYYISGVPRAGVYDITNANNKPNNLRQALAAAGYDGPPAGQWLTLVHHDENGNKTSRTVNVDDVLNTPAGATELQPNDVVMVGKIEQGEYYIGGHVPRTGVYSLTARRVTLLQALIAAGADPEQMKQQELIVRQKNNPQKISHFTIGELIEDRGDPYILAPNDVVEVLPIKGDKADHFVRLVIDKDQLTFEGKPITWDTLKAELEKIPDRPHTALQLAIGSEDVTIGQQNKARSTSLSLVTELGFKYLTEIGIHPLGSKAGDEPSPTK
jgi:protein involved in polysaccharide export with SLBB domain